MLKIRASSLGKIMSNGRNNDGLSKAAKTFIMDLAKQHIYGYEPNIKSKYLEKGIRTEDECIKLVNAVLPYKVGLKNEERRENDWINGTCDVVTQCAIHEIKSCWSLNTFPAIISEDDIDHDYEWQCRAYMMLWDIEHANLLYCMVNTPLDLIGYEDERIHIVDSIDPHLRITKVDIQRDKEKEELIKHKVSEVRVFYNECISEIKDSHNFSNYF